MSFPELSWLAILAGFVVYFVTGAIWFGPKTFYPAWMRLRGKDPAEPQGSHGMAVVFGATAVGALVQVFTLAVILGFVAQATGDPVGPLGGALGGLLFGLGLVAASSLSHRLFGGDGFRVWAIEVGGDVVGLTLAGLVVGLLS
ncbi:DUF1761 domain-containing protein [Microcella alkalica]|uniref:DUF1761 domain-containing protein n=1 Tax=Microcella alkalica TaxID=355930 RepID=UPI00145E55C5|nr:DUF1761 domain-containing protein [Microcella alkalica]